MKLQSLSRALFVVMLLLALSFANAQSTLYFDGGSTNILTDGNGASTGGAGTWDTTILNWDQGNLLPHVAWTNANGDNAVIAGSGTLTIGEAVTVGTLTLSYTTGGRTVSGATITINGGISFGSPAGLTWTAPIILGGNQTWSLGGSNSTGKSITGGTDLNGYELTWNSGISNNGTPTHSNITGNGSIVKDGTGSVWMSGANTYTGSTTVRAGGLSINSTGLGNVNNQLTVNGGTLNMATFSLTVGNLTGTGGVITGSSGTRTLTIGSGNAGGGNFQGVIQDGAGTNALTKIGTGTITLSGTNTYTGLTSINGGTLVVTGTIVSNVTVGAAGSLSPVAGGAGTLGIGGNLDISAMAGGDGKLLFDLGAVAGTSDKIAVTGTLTIGDGALGISDFGFTNLGGMGAGTYTLITSGGITGTLNSSDLLGGIGGPTAVLQINGSNLELVVIPGGTVLVIR